MPSWLQEFVHSSPFTELAVLLGIGAFVGFVGLLLRQPMIVSFIAVGVVVGPSAMGIVETSEHVDLLAELGVAVLLFLVGLKLDVQLVRTLGVVSLATGLGQVAFTSIIGFGLGLLLGLGWVASTYVAVALTFSSTIIIVKLLSDKREVDSLHGRIAIGFLIVQDLVVVLAMIVLSALGVAGGGLGHGGGGGGGGGAEAEVVNGVAASGGWIRVALILVYGVAAVGFVALFIRYIATPLINRISRSPELLVTFSIAWAAILAALGGMLGFSMELGGLLAGISLASTPAREAIVSRLASLRDFLLLFFFIALGSKLDLSLLGTQIGPALVFSLFVLVGNPLIVMVIMGVMGFRKRTGFLAGLTVAQISEFSLIFVAMGVTLGHVGNEELGLVTLVGLITIAMSVYMITWSHALYRRLEPWLSVFERAEPHREPTPLGPTSNVQAGGGDKTKANASSDSATTNKPTTVTVSQTTEKEQSHGHGFGHADVIIFGLGRYGSAIAERLERRGVKLLTVDFNPDEVRRWQRKGHCAVYGDACDHEFLESLPLDGVRWVVAALPQHDTGLLHDDPRIVLIDGLKRRKFLGKVAVSAHHLHEADRLKTRGADLVLLPFRDAADRADVVLAKELGLETSEA